LGAGGAIFNQGNLTLNGDTLTNNQAIGGSSGGIAGGGMGSSASGGTGGGFGGNFSITGGPTGGTAASGGGGGAGFQSTDKGNNASGKAGGSGGGLGGFGGGAAGDGGGGAVFSTFSGGGGGSFGTGGTGTGGGGTGTGGGGIGGGGFGNNGGNGGFGAGGGFGGGGGAGFGGGGGFGNYGGGTGTGGGGAGMGGGIFSMFGSLTITNSTLSGNTAQGGNGGAIVGVARVGGGSGYGVAFFNLDGNATLTYVTIANNTASAGTAGTGGTAGKADGSGVYNLAYGNTITQGGANAAILTLNNSVIGQNSGGNNLVNDAENAKNTNLVQINGSSSAVQGGAEQLGKGLNLLATGTITVTTAPNLATTLANNGGLTETLAPLSNSPIIGAGIASLVNLPGVDQRGLGRPSVSSSVKPDDGAFQTQSTTTSVTNVTTIYTKAGRKITLTAHVYAFDGPSQPASEGDVDFTVNGLAAGSMVPVVNGVATTTFTLPSTLNEGSYDIHASYTDTNTPSLYHSSSGDGTLDLTSADSTLTVSATNSPVSFNSGSETLDLTANLSSSNGGTVGEGDVVFTVNGVSTNPIAVSNGTASTTLTLTGPSLLLAGTYVNEISAHYTDATNNYDPADAMGDVAVSAVATTTAIASMSTNVSSTFNSTTSQKVTLSATVGSSTDGTINEGNVTFTVTNPNGVNLTAVGMVTGDTATATLTIPAGFAAGSYSFTAAYADSVNGNGVLNYSASPASNSGTLTVNAAATTTTLTSTALSSTYNSTIAQKVTLSATVDSSTGGPVNEGIVTFTVGTLTATANVSAGKATTTLTIPAGFAAGSYTLNASYADNSNANGVVNYSAKTATNSGTLTVNTAATTTTLTSTAVSTYNSTTAQMVSLSATVNSGTGGTVNEGNVTFTLTNPNGTNLTATANVTAGKVTTTLTIPAGFVAGSYTLNASYADNSNANGVVNFESSPSAMSGKLTVNAAATQATLLTPALIITSSSTTAQTVGLGAVVASGNGGSVNEGSVTFFLGGLRATAHVTGGIAVTVLTLPAGLAAGSYILNASYADSANANGVVNFKPSTASPSGTLTVNAAPPPSSSASAGVNSPIGSVSLFALGLGPTGLDVFAVDSKSEVFARSLFGGDWVRVSPSLQLLVAVLSDNGLLALLAGENGQVDFIDVLNPFLPLVEPAVLAALHL
jgi:hypothetical protein